MERGGYRHGKVTKWLNSLVSRSLNFMPCDLIIDANSLYARAFYATGGDPYETVKASVNSAISLLDPERVGEHVDRAMFCWDGGQKKAKERTERPPEYEDTKPRVKAVFEALIGAKNVRIKGYEADDVIATAAFASKSENIVVASGDKDLHQLQGGNIAYYDLNTKCLLSSREIVAQWHVRRTSHVAIALAIQGDSVDKIIGIRGWGPKKVEKLFESVRSDMPFDEVLKVIESQIPENKLPEFYESLELTLLNSGVPGVPEPEPLTLAPYGKIIELGLDDCAEFYTRIAGLY